MTPRLGSPVTPELDLLTVRAKDNSVRQESDLVNLFAAGATSNVGQQRLYTFGGMKGHSVFDGITINDCVSDLCARPTLYPALWDKSIPHMLAGVRSPLRPAPWRDMLFSSATADLDALFLLDGVINGFKLVDPGADIKDYITDNYYSAAITSQDEVNDIIVAELAQGKFSIVDSKPVCVHAIGAVPKSSGGIRNITDCSRPHGESVNNFMKETFSSFRYKSMDDVVALVGQGTYMAVTDIASAYRTVPIRPSDRTYQGLKWVVDGQETYVQDNFLSFGTRVAPFIFSRISDSIVRHLADLGISAVNYLDDFIVLVEDFDSCKQAQLTLHSLLRDLGFVIAYKKVVSPSTMVTYLGVEVDSVAMELRLPQSKLCKLSQELEFFYGQEKGYLTPNTTLSRRLESLLYLSAWRQDFLSSCDQFAQVFRIRITLHHVGKGFPV